MKTIDLVGLVLSEPRTITTAITAVGYYITRLISNLYFFFFLEGGGVRSEKIIITEKDALICEFRRRYGDEEASPLLPTLRPSSVISANVAG